jgi:hypothetical protein
MPTNPNKPFGFQPITVDGKECRVKKYAKATGIVYPGDVLVLGSAGTVAVAATGQAIIGVAAEYRASADTEIAVYDDPDTEFMVQVSGSFAAADVGQNADIKDTTGDTALKSSKHQIESVSQGTTSTLQFKFMGLMNKGDNAVGANAIIRVRPNNHILKSAGTTGV